MAATKTIKKLQNGNVLITHSATRQTTLNPQANLFREDETLFITDCCGTKDEFTADQIISVERQDGTVVPIAGDMDLLFAELSEYFFFRVTQSGGGSDTENPKMLLSLTTVQDLNDVGGTFVDFSTVDYNDIPGATVSANGTVTLPPGRYKTSFKINHEFTTGVRKNVVAVITSQSPSNLFVIQSATFSYLRNAANPEAVLFCPSYAPPEMNLLAARDFRILCTQAGDGGVSNSRPGLSFWQIEKIDKS